MADDDDEEIIQEFEPRKTISDDTLKDELDKQIDVVNRNAAYQIRPPISEKFKALAVKEVINAILHEELGGKEYSDEDSVKWTKNIVTNVKLSVKELGFKRYKLIVQTILGQNKGSGVKVGARCLWDADTDNCASDSFLNDTIFCCVIVFGIYSY
ncbi:UNVERIFIED_CONTAM: hypothetical protein PYX00_003848 [Menopon gallinae]|uniref:Uncharacterized protein n=1 Tax=Menopon gallinae TaxID=328185 RepID=A0AAW2I1X6_9NEOP